tara:strand:- start:3417 stop:3980 length:564 start_codon:yes stop_codon:yes gene_type:complete
MKMKIILGLIIIFGGFGQAFGQFFSTPKLPKLVEKEIYEKTLKNYTSWQKNLANPDFYKKLVWEGKGFKKTFSELTEFEKDQLFLVQGFTLERELVYLTVAWENEVMWLKSGRIPEIPENAAAVEEIEGFQKQLLTLQKKTATEFEKLVDTLFKKHEDKIAIEERNFIKRKIIKFHDRLQLVERNDS